MEVNDCAGRGRMGRGVGRRGRMGRGRMVKPTSSQTFMHFLYFNV
jgi:hypothetical protein